MEFPDFGKQCAHKDCKQLDFLPVQCDHCQAMFCKDHSRADSHECTPIDNTSNSGAKLVSNLVFNYVCKIDLHLRSNYS